MGESAATIFYYAKVFIIVVGYLSSLGSVSGDVFSLIAHRFVLQQQFVLWILPLFSLFNATKILILCNAKLAILVIGVGLGQCGQRWQKSVGLASLD